MKRELLIHDTEAHGLVASLVSFLGEDQVLNRIRQMHRILSIESGIYLHYWVEPNASFWLGLETCQNLIRQHGTLAGLLNNEMYYPIELATKLHLFSDSMPQARLVDIRSRILKSDYLAPVFLEIDTVAHYWELGYDIEWPQPPSNGGIRIPEFIASAEHMSVEVECKSQSPDSGRMVARPRFYRVADEIWSILASSNLAGKVLISVPTRLPAPDSWKSELLAAIRDAATPGSHSITLGDSTVIELSLLTAKNFVVSTSELIREAASLQVPHSHIALSGSRNSDSVQAPLIIRVRSTSPDRVLSSYFKDLRDANRQLSGTRAGVITCFVPEIQSFQGLQSGSALHNMTAAFFQQHAKPSVYAVSYVSDSVAIQEDLQITRTSPALVLYNHLYDKKYGENMPLLFKGASRPTV